MADWLTELRSLGVSAIAEQLGLYSPRPRSLAPCPSCGEERRGSGDRRGPIGIRRDDLGWECHRCKIKGDAITLAAWILCGTPRPQREEWQKLKTHFWGPEPLRITFRPRPPRPTPSAPARPPQREIVELWEACHPLYDDPELSSQLRARAISPERVAERDLARAIPPRISLPHWAFGPLGPWNRSGHRLLLPLFDERGRFRSIHARSLAGPPQEAPRPKGLSPARFAVSGLLFADNPARLLLQEGASPEGGPEREEDLSVIIAEGVPDFLTWSTYHPEEEKTHPALFAVFGILAGSWSPALAARLPRACRVMVRTHPDAAGEKYADQICRSLLPRGLRVFRRKKEVP